MGRRSKTQPRTAAEIEYEIIEQAEHHALLVNDLQDALLAGENTRSYREAIAAIGDKIHRLRTRLEEVKSSELQQRRASTATLAAEMLAESHRRHRILLADYQIPNL